MMSEQSAEITTQAAAESGQQSGGQSGNFTPPATQADLDRIIADRLARERAKFADYDDIKAKAAEYDKVVEAQKTEAEKTAERVAELEAKVKEYETREQIAAWKAEVAEATGVPAAALAGSTKEEIEAHAETLKPLIAAAQQQPEVKPSVVPTVGKVPQSPPNISIADQIAAAEAAGDKALVAELKALQLGAVST